MDILMPQLGETVTEGTITVWHKTAGDKIQPGDGLFEIETDKTSMEIPATEAGVLTEIRVAAGNSVPVGTVVAVLSNADSGALAATPSTARTPTPAGSPSAAPTKAAGPPLAEATAAPAAKGSLDSFHSVHTPERNFGAGTLASGIKVTPVARRLAAQLNVDLIRLQGSGPRGRIVAVDVQAAASRPRATAATAPTADQIKALYANTPFVEVPLDNMRRTIARRLLDAKQTIPHFYLARDVQLDRLLEARTDINQHAGMQYKLSINDFVIKALALALQKVPAANAAWAEDRILRFTASDIAVAVAVDGGLITPVIRNAESKSLRNISEEMKSLATRTRSKELKRDEYQGGSITVSNLGMYGVHAFSAIVNPPQAAILAIGAAERRPLEARDGSVHFGSVMTATLSCDHRVIDGALGAQLLASFTELMQSPFALFA